MNRFLSLSFATALTAVSATAVQADGHSPNLVEAAESAGTFGTLLAAVEAAGLGGALLEAENITVFAPTDDAFAALPEGTVESLLLPENKDQLVAILTYHVVPATVIAGDIPEGETMVDTLNSEDPIKVTLMGGLVMVDGANVIAADIEIANGVIHVIDSVLLPDGE